MTVEKNRFSPDHPGERQGEVNSSNEEKALQKFTEHGFKIGHIVKTDKGPGRLTAFYVSPNSDMTKSLYTASVELIDQATGKVIGIYGAGLAELKRLNRIEYPPDPSEPLNVKTDNTNY